MAAKGDGLDVIEPKAHPAAFAGRIEHIRPIRVGKLPAFSRAIQPILPALTAAFGGGRLDAAAIVAMIGEHGDAFFDALSIASEIPRQELEDGDIADLLEVVAKVMAANRDFLTGRLIQALRATVPTTGAGPTPSKH